jgi:OOP family OmpA-OmpF porin
MRHVWVVGMVGAVALGVQTGRAAAEGPGCKDHPLFPRMSGFQIDRCDAQPFAAQRFRDGEGNELEIEGQAQTTSYVRKPGALGTSELQVLRNFTAAIRRIGGQVLSEDAGNAYLRVEQGGREIFAHVAAYEPGESYRLTIVERPAMRQTITASQLIDELNRAGSVALRIHFDPNKATILPDSQPILEQVAELMRSQAELRLSVEGHTDNTGTAQANKALSQRRAESVVAALVQKGVARARLAAVGWGQERPVADNLSDQGRDKNRRIELVKK